MKGSTILVSLAILASFPAAVLAQSQTRVVDARAVNHRLEIGPIEGLIVEWHQAPTATAVPLGATLRFRVAKGSASAATWKGAREVERRGRWSVAEYQVERLGSHLISVEYDDEAGQRIEERSVLTAVDTALHPVRVSRIRASADLIVLDPANPNAATMSYFFRGSSIAALRTVDENSYRTSSNRWLTLDATVEPPGFAPLIEWRVNGRPQRHLGLPIQMRVFPPRLHTIAAGPVGRAAELELEVYRAIITSHRRGDRVPEGAPVTFRATTDPRGFEGDITWLASTKYGACAPVTGTGPEFTVRFDDTFGAGAQWLGVRADDSTFAQDLKRQELAYVANEASDTISVIDMVSDKVFSTVPVGDEPRWLTLSRDRRHVYVANHSGNSVSKIDTASNTTVTTFPVEAGPCWIEFLSEDEDRFFGVSNRDAGSFTVLDVLNDTTVATLQMGPGALTNWSKPVSGNVAVAAFSTETGKTEQATATLISVINEGLDNVTVVAVPDNGARPFVFDTVPTGHGSAPRWIDVLLQPESNRGTVYLSLFGSDSVMVIDFPAIEVVKQIAVGDGPHWIRLTPDARFAYVVNSLAGTVSKISTATNEVVVTIDVGAEPRWVAITDDSSSVYVPSSATDSVAIISVADDSVATVHVGDGPTWVAFSPDDLKAYVVNKEENSVSVVSTATHQVLKTLGVGRRPNMIVTERHEHTMSPAPQP